jgi:hypothetical protein
LQVASCEAAVSSADQTITLAPDANIEQIAIASDHISLPVPLDDYQAHVRAPANRLRCRKVCSPELGLFIGAKAGGFQSSRP